MTSSFRSDGRDYSTPGSSGGTGRAGRIQRRARAGEPNLYTVVTTDGQTLRITSEEASAAGVILIAEDGSRWLPTGQALGEVRSIDGDLEPPVAPTNLQAASAGHDSIDLTWDAGSDNVGVTMYLVYLDGVLIGSTADLTFTDTGLEPETTYHYRVRSVDAAGNVSGTSNEAQATTDAYVDVTAPSVPANVQVAVASETVIDVTWESSSDDVGVVGYRVYRDNVLVRDTATLQFHDTGLSPSTLYSYEVSAYDAAENESARSAAVEGTTDAIEDHTAPSVPQNLNATALDSFNVELTWDASTDNVGVTGYKIFRNTVLVQTVGAVTTWLDDTVGPGNTYSYRVSAIDAAANESAKSTADSVETPDEPDTEPPTVPQNLTATAVSPTRIDLDWDPSTDNLAVTGYRIYRDNVFLIEVAGTAYQNTGLTELTTYSYEVTAVDSADNESARSTADEATTTDGSAPTVPQNLVATALDEDTVELTWDASTDNVAVTAYKVYRDGVLVQTLGNVLTTQINGHTVGQTYSFQVLASDAAGNESAKSTADQATMPDQTAPSVPTNLIADSEDGSTVDLLWDASTDNLAVTGYRIYRDNVFLIEVAGTSHQDTGLDDATTYSYEVSAVDAASNESARSTADAATTLDITPPSVPSNVVATTVDDSSITVTWDASTDNVGVAGYKVFRDDVLVATLGNVLEWTDTGLEPSTLYSYKVSARDDVWNESDLSTAASATTDAGGAATIAFVSELGEGEVTSISGGQSAEITLPAGATADNCVVLRGAIPGAGPFNTVTDSRGNTWTILVQRASGGSHSVFIAITHQDAAPLQTGDVITVAWTNSEEFLLYNLREFSDVDATTPLGEVASNNTNGTTVDSGTTAALDGPGHLAVGAFSEGTGAQATWTPDGDWTDVCALASASPVRGLLAADKLNAEETGEQLGGTKPTASAWAGVIATLRPGAGGSPPPPPPGGGGGDSSGLLFYDDMAAAVGETGTDTGTPPWTKLERGVVDPAGNANYAMVLDGGKKWRQLTARSVDYDNGHADDLRVHIECRYGGVNASPDWFDRGDPEVWMGAWEKLPANHLNTITSHNFVHMLQIKHDSNTGITAGPCVSFRGNSSGGWYVDVDGGLTIAGEPDPNNSGQVTLGPFSWELNVEFAWMMRLTLRHTQTGLIEIWRKVAGDPDYTLLGSASNIYTCYKESSNDLKDHHIRHGWYRKPVAPGNAKTQERLVRDFAVAPTRADLEAWLG